MDGAEGLRIALFCANFQGVPDGASKVLNRLVAFLRERGAAVRVYSAAVTEPAADIVRVPSVPIPGRPEYRLSLGLTKSLHEDVRRFGPSLVHISVPDLLGTQAQAFARQLGVPVVASLHTRFETYLRYYGLGFLRPLVERRLKHFYSRCDLVLIPNAPIAEEVRAKGWSQAVRVWSRGVDRTLFNPARRSLSWRQAQGFADQDVVLLFFGRLVREKGLDIFLATLSELGRRGCDVKVLVVGDGPERDRMRRDLPHAIFTGHLEGEELARAVASADILINPSTTETFGNVTLEAMASGLAIVSADVPSARALVTDRESGLLVSAHDPLRYAEAITELVGMPFRRKEFGNAAAATSRDFDWDKVLGSVLGAYRSLDPLQS